METIKYSICTFLLLFVITTNAQIDAAFDLESSSESLEALEDWQNQPIQVNQIKSINEQHPFLDISDIIAIELHISEYGALVNKYELSAVEGLSDDGHQFLFTQGVYNQFIDKQTVKEAFVSGQHMLETRLIHRYTDQLNLDDFNHETVPLNRFVRYQYNASPQLRFGVTLESDANEHNYRPDHIGFHLSANIPNKGLQLLLGDFNLNIGQGLIGFQGFGLGKSGYATAVKKHRNIVTPHTSGNEINFLRGGALKWTKRSIENTFIASRKLVDGVLLNADSITSIATSGLHTTSTEKQRRKNTEQLTFGHQLKFSKRNGHIALNNLYNRLDKSLRLQQNQDDTELYAKQFLNSSIDYHLNIENWHFFGELATNNQFQWASLQGLNMNLGKHLNLAVVHRYFSPSYHHFFGNAFAELSRTTNEHGLYIGATITPKLKRLQLNAYIDFFEQLSPSKTVANSFKGHESMIQLQYTPSKKQLWMFRVKHEQQARNDASSEQLKTLLSIQKTSLRIHTEQKINQFIRLKTRFEVNRFEDNNITYGYLLFQDINYQKLSSPVSFNARITYFNAQRFDNRVYAYENHVPSYFAIPFYHHSGYNTQVLLKFKIGLRSKISVKLSRTVYQSTLKLPHKNEIALHYRYRFKR